MAIVVSWWTFGYMWRTTPEAVDWVPWLILCPIVQTIVLPVIHHAGHGSRPLCAGQSYFLDRDSVYMGFIVSMYRQRWTYLDACLVRTYHADLSLMWGGLNLLMQSLCLFIMPKGEPYARVCVGAACAIALSYTLALTDHAPDNARPSTAVEPTTELRMLLGDVKWRDFLRICRAAECAMPAPPADFVFANLAPPPARRKLSSERRTNLSAPLQCHVSLTTPVATNLPLGVDMPVEICIAGDAVKCAVKCAAAMDRWCVNLIRWCDHVYPHWRTTVPCEPVSSELIDICFLSARAGQACIRALQSNSGRGSNNSSRGRPSMC